MYSTLLVAQQKFWDPACRILHCRSVHARSCFGVQANIFRSLLNIPAFQSPPTSVKKTVQVGVFKFKIGYTSTVHFERRLCEVENVKKNKLARALQEAAGSEHVLYFC